MIEPLVFGFIGGVVGALVFRWLSNRQEHRVYVVQGWDEEPRAAFDSYTAARAFVESQPDYEKRELEVDGTGSECYPFINELVVGEGRG
jgi:hypothetical protein